MPGKGISRRIHRNGTSSRGNHDSARKDSRRPPSPTENGLLFESMLERLDVGVANVSPAGAILYANLRFAEMLSAHPHEIVRGASLGRFVSAASWPALQSALAQGATRPTLGEMKVESGRGGLRTVQLSLAPILSGRTPAVMIAATEITELIQKNKALEASQEALHSLSGRILQLQDQERRRIARDLHDITGQELACVVMSLNRAAKNLDNPEVNARQILTDTADLVRKVEDEIRTLSYLLHPPLLDEFGLRSALNWYVDGFTKRSGIAVSVEVPKSLPRFSIEKEIALFRVVQESLTNVMRHSHSSRARIRLWWRNSAVHLSVDDEGSGICKEALAKIAEGTTSGVGTSGMRERLQQLGGSLTVQPRATGTQVAAVLPIDTSEDAAAELEHDAESSSQEGSSRRTPAPNAKKRILIVDDHEVTRQGIKTLLKNEPSLEVCGEAQGGLEAVSKAKELNPDLIIMDISMPGASGFAAATAIRNSGAPAKVLFFTTYTHAETERMSRLAGFAGLVTKTNAARDLVRGVHAILAGYKFFGSDVVDAGGEPFEGKLGPFMKAFE